MSCDVQLLHYAVISSLLLPGIDEFRLTDGQGLRDGIVEVLTGGAWTPVCYSYSYPGFVDWMCEILG